MPSNVAFSSGGVSSRRVNQNVECIDGRSFSEDLVSECAVFVLVLVHSHEDGVTDGVEEIDVAGS